MCAAGERFSFLFYFLFASPKNHLETQLETQLETRVTLEIKVLSYSQTLQLDYLNFFCAGKSFLIKKYYNCYRDMEHSLLKRSLEILYKFLFLLIYEISTPGVRYKHFKVCPYENLSL